uniref:Uncharacterized protein n=1 Tax=Rhizophora mucronata TaxID=61149 RepID=A0A2P2NMQ7_RHIMU
MGTDSSINGKFENSKLQLLLCDILLSFTGVL